jgi:MFS family permease
MTNLGAITGTLVVGFSLGAATGPTVGGFIFDATQSYFISFLVGAGAASLAVIFLAMTRRENKNKFQGPNPKDQKNTKFQKPKKPTKQYDMARGATRKR